MIARVLVAVDDSPRAPGVLEMANAIAEQFDAHIFLLRVASVPPELPAAGAGARADGVERAVGAETEAALGRLSADMPRVEVLLAIVGAQAPWRAIVSSAERLDVDLVVIGSHGHRPIDSVLGTTAAKVVDHAARPVLVVHERKRVAR